MALAAILTWRRVWGAASPNVTFGTNKKLSIKTAAARDWALPLAPGAILTLTPGCYPDMAPATSPWALAAILTWRRVLGVAQGLGCGQAPGALS